jgi:hypothetical protein
MPARFAPRTFAQILQDVEEASTWYRGLGIETAGTRLEAIEGVVRELLADLDTQAPEDTVARWSNERTYYALTDGMGFGRIARAMSKVGPNLLPRQKLRTILEGPLFLADEQPGDESVNARNVFTEFELAADFSEKGIQPVGFDDLQFEFEGVAYAVQCKRLHSKSRVRENIDGAYRQLQGNLRSDQHRGLIGLSIDKILGLDKMILHLERAEDLNDEVRTQLDKFRAAYQTTWLNFIDTRVIGLLLILRFLCLTVPLGIVGPAYYLGFATLAAPETLQASDLNRLRRLAETLRSRTEEITKPFPGSPPP